MTASSKADLTRTSKTTPQEKGRDDSTRYFVYVARCSDGTLYTGYTTDPKRRIERHNRGSGSRYTRARRPVELAYLEEARSLGEALSRERRIKSLKRREKLLLCMKYGKGGA